MKDYIALVTVKLHKFARQIAGGERRQRSLRRVEPMSEMAWLRKLSSGYEDSMGRVLIARPRQVRFKANPRPGC
jgi:hypothetical protein